MSEKIWQSTDKMIMYNIFCQGAQCPKKIEKKVQLESVCVIVKG